MFSGELLNIKILTVLELRWESNIRVSETRPFHALSIRLRGDADFICKGKKIHVKSNDIVFVPKGMEYTLDHSAEHLYAVHFDTEAPLPDKISVISLHNTSLIKGLFASMYESWLSSKVSERYNSYADFYRILSELARLNEHADHNAETDKLAFISNYIHGHFRESSLSVASLSDIFGTSESYFRRAFTKRFSVSPLKYINALRLEYARELLHSGYYSIRQVAEMSGFRDVKYFSRFIKMETGLSPRDIKKLEISHEMPTIR